MYYLLVPTFNLILGWSPKCACTTAKTAILMALGHQVTGNVHNDMLTNENMKSGTYGIYSFVAYREHNDFRPRDYLKVSIIRNPYSRFISAIRQRSHTLSKDTRFCKMTAGDYLDYLERNSYGEYHHFRPQTKNLRAFGFDQVLDISEMGSFFKILGLPYQGERRFGHHATSYGGSELSTRSASLFDLTKIKDFSGSIDAWLDEERVAKLRHLYARDFDFARSHGHDYELPCSPGRSS